MGRRWSEPVWGATISLISTRRRSSCSKTLLNDLTEASNSAESKCDQLKRREEELAKELETVRAEIAKEEGR